VKNILHCIDTTGPGGAETVFIDLASRLPDDKYRPVVLIRGKGWVYEELQRRGIQPVLMDAKGSFNVRFLRGLCALIRREKIDLIQSHLLGSNVYCAMAGLITRKPVVATFHGSVDIGDNERFKALKFAVINAGAFSIVPVSDLLREDILGRTTLKKEKVQVVYNGIDTSVFQREGSNKLREKFGWSANDLIIGSLGNIRSAKGYDILLRAAALLKETHSTCRFVIAGQSNSKLYDELLALRQQLGLETTVHFIGFIDDAAEFLASLDIFLSSSVSEGLPLSAIQAMVSKLPIIATRCGGWQELINHGENGWLVDVDNPEAIAAAIRTLASDTERCQHMAQNARESAIRSFDIQVMLTAYQHIYEQATCTRTA
jgi:glycosyltransferase involved in cell wall biosynthesis